MGLSCPWNEIYTSSSQVYTPGSQALDSDWNYTPSFPGWFQLADSRAQDFSALAKSHNCPFSCFSAQPCRCLEDRSCIRRPRADGTQGLKGPGSLQDPGPGWPLSLRGIPRQHLLTCFALQSGGGSLASQRPGWEVDGQGRWAGGRGNLSPL